MPYRTALQLWSRLTPDQREGPPPPRPLCRCVLGSDSPAIHAIGLACREPSPVRLSLKHELPRCLPEIRRALGDLGLTLEEANRLQRVHDAPLPADTADPETYRYQRTLQFLQLAVRMEEEDPEGAPEKTALLAARVERA